MGFERSRNVVARPQSRNTCWRDVAATCKILCHQRTFSYVNRCAATLPRYVFFVLRPVGGEILVEEDRRTQEGSSVGPQNIDACHFRQATGASFGRSRSLDNIIHPMWLVRMHLQYTLPTNTAIRSTLKTSHMLKFAWLTSY